MTDGDTGLLAPTLMVPGATADATARLVLESHSYDHFLAECSQAVAVESAAAARAFTRLIGDEGERRRMGAAARRTALQRFSWAEVIPAYERLWSEQEDTRQEVERHRGHPPDTTRTGLYPSPEVAFEGYPTRWLGDDVRLTAPPGAAARLGVLLALPLITHAEWARHTDPAVATEAVLRGRGRSRPRSRPGTGSGLLLRCEPRPAARPGHTRLDAQVRPAPALVLSDRSPLTVPATGSPGL